MLRVGKGQALVFETDSIAFAQLANGMACAFIWVGADDEAHVIEAVLSAPEKAWKKTRQTFSMVGDALALIDAAKPGSGKPNFVGKLRPGRYARGLRLRPT